MWHQCYPFALKLCFSMLCLTAPGLSANVIQKCLDCSKSAQQNHASYDSAMGLWNRAKTAYQDQKYEEAVELLNDAIDNYAQEDNLFFRLERAKMREKADDLEGCREDLWFVINYCEAREIAPPYYLKALGGLLTLCTPDESALAIELYTKIHENDPNLPIYDIADNIMTISNLSPELATTRFRDQMANVFCLAGYCRSAKDVTLTQDNKIKIHLHTPCPKSPSPQSSNTIACQNNCTSASAFAYGACGRMPNAVCFLVCTGAVDSLRRGCEWCCQTDANWDFCARLLRNFVPPPCDPAWD